MSYRLRIAYYLVVALLVCGLVSAEELRVSALKQPRLPFSFTGLLAVDDSVAEKAELSFTLKNGSGEAVTSLHLRVLYLDSEGKINGGQGLRFSDLVTTSNGDLAGKIGLFPRTLAKSASLIVICIVEVTGESQTWREEIGEILDHLKDLRPAATIT